MKWVHEQHLKKVSPLILRSSPKTSVSSSLLHFKWTETGEPGKLGRHVQKPVALERKSVRACAVTHLRATVARNAGERSKDHVNVIRSRARVSFGRRLRRLVSSMFFPEL